MPIPDTPYTRKEAYLNAIATGDSGGIPETPYTREEMYLDAIARNGGGGGGSGGGVLALRVDTQTGALDKTWQEIYDQINAGTICVVFQPFSNDGTTGLESLMVTSVEDQTQAEWGNGYAVICSGGFSLSAQTPNDYPTAPMG